ncbi:hypothetical protein T4B_14595 [Trichinella pseudospiralis]|uniref:Uncharacterized protein n=1 Tax=Trichinella pseudospiralis TaxID=6337 RepID=A0A0V1FA09_TRIPS|nr:hypothetical protein T4B_14595 [Trichinella pseudospiralis]
MLVFQKYLENYVTWKSRNTLIPFLENFKIF